MTTWLLALVKWPSWPVVHPTGLQEQTPSGCFEAMFGNSLPTSLSFFSHIWPCISSCVVWSWGRVGRAGVKRLSHGLEKRKVNEREFCSPLEWLFKVKLARQRHIVIPRVNSNQAEMQLCILLCIFLLFFRWMHFERGNPNLKEGK